MTDQIELMMNKQKNPSRKKPSERKPDPRPQRENRADRKDLSPSEASEDTDPNAASSANPSPKEVITTWRKPVTNQDDQEKITNAGGDDIPVQE